VQKSDRNTSQSLLSQKIGQLVDIATNSWVLPILLSANFIGLSKYWQNAVIFLMHPDNFRKKAQQSKSRQLSCSNTSRYIFINKQTRWTMEYR